jgi:MFS family permease
MDAAKPSIRRPLAPGTQGAAPLALYVVEAMSSVGGTLLSIGIYFYMEHRFGWRMRRNFMLAAGQGVIYVPGALLAGRVAATFGRKQTLCAVYSVLALLTVSACAIATTGGVWAGGGVAALLLAYTFVIGISWPVLEGMVAGFGPTAGMARRVAIYNVVWPAAGAAAVALEGTVIQGWIAGIFLMPCGLHLGAIGVLWASRARRLRNPPMGPVEGQMDVAGGQTSHSLQAEPELLRKRKLALWLSRTALPATYTVIYGLMPMMPSLPVMHHLSTPIQTVVASVWLMTRWLAFVILALGAWWHTRPRVLLWAAVAMLIAFFGMTLPLTHGANPLADLVSMILWQAVLGLALGMIYSGSLYFGMVLSDGSTEHGGYHEALIGLGWVLGPAAGALAQRIRPDELWVGIAAVGAVIAASVVVVVMTAIVMGWKDPERLLPRPPGPAIR